MVGKYLFAVQNEIVGFVKPDEPLAIQVEAKFVAHPGNGRRNTGNIHRFWRLTQQPQDNGLGRTVALSRGAQRPE